MMNGPAPCFSMVSRKALAASKVDRVVATCPEAVMMMSKSIYVLPCFDVLRLLAIGKERKSYFQGLGAAGCRRVNPMVRNVFL